MNQMSIMVVDDKKENLLAYEAILSSLPYQLIALQSGEDALRYILTENTEDLAVILLDVQLQGIDGFETAKLMKQHEKVKDIPIIFITANHKSIDQVLYGYHVGSVDYILKPFHPDLLRSKVEAFAMMHRYSHEKLRKSQERFEKMFVSSPCLMAIRRLSDLTYIDVNETWLQFTGYAKEEVIGKNDEFFCISPEKSAQNEYEPGTNCLNVQIRYKTKGGEIRDGLLSVQVMEIDHEMCELSVIIDITEKVNWEKEMVRLGKLNLIGEMAASIAHEIRNPMTTIKGFLQFSKENRKLTNEYIDMMLEELNRANNIINEYLSLAKNKPANLQPKQINDIVNLLLPLMEADAILAGKMIETQLGNCPEILLDEKEIRQLILNICINGLEAMEHGKQLTISTYQQDAYVILKISDQGRGIPPKHLEQLGTPFFTTKESGTGLGLAVCYSIAARHRAEIKVDSTERGTTFYIQFPILHK